MAAFRTNQGRIRALVPESRSGLIMGDFQSCFLPPKLGFCVTGPRSQSGYFFSKPFLSKLHSRFVFLRRAGYLLVAVFLVPLDSPRGFGGRAGFAKPGGFVGSRGCSSGFFQEKGQSHFELARKII